MMPWLAAGHGPAWVWTGSDFVLCFPVWSVVRVFWVVGLVMVDDSSVLGLLRFCGFAVLVGSPG